jgi:para-aminobenzoate synthetase component 1
VQWKQKMLSWAKRFNIFCFLDNQNYSVRPQQYECLLGAGAGASVSPGRLEDLDEFIGNGGEWIMGHLAYELKNMIHHLGPGKENRIGFPSFFFFRPLAMLQIKAHELCISAENPDKIYRELLNEKTAKLPVVLSLSLQQKLSKEEYLDKIRSLQDHIIRGDCYEINFCQEFFSENALIEPAEVFRQLMDRSPNPFSALYRLDDRYLISASPERFLVKKGRYIFSQPMKGTIMRNVDHPGKDILLKEELEKSVKDQAENVMVVDMVRNDLSKICLDDSVMVEELFGVYSYPQVHQMISTIRGELKAGIKFSEILAATFPMGSMTGAPKYRVMELIDEYEVSARGIFSGSVGYIQPGGDFDFSVVIRSIMYNAQNRYLSYQVGSGITFYSDPEKEWEECLLKGRAIKKVLTS